MVYTVNQDFYPIGSKTGTDMNVLFKIAERIFKTEILKAIKPHCSIWQQGSKDLTGHTLALAIQFFKSQKNTDLIYNFICYF